MEREREKQRKTERERASWRETAGKERGGVKEGV